MALTGTENIRDVTFYPRDVDRLTPWSISFQLENF
jgi:aspartyl-tRNA synthetase